MELLFNNSLQYTLIHNIADMICDLAKLVLGFQLCTPHYLHNIHYLSYIMFTKPFFLLIEEPLCMRLAAKLSKTRRKLACHLCCSVSKKTALLQYM